MASSAAPYGFKPINLIGGQPYAGSTRQIKIASGYATNIFNGSVVQIETDGTVGLVGEVGTAASQFPVGVVGVFVGCSYTDPNTKQKLFSQYWPASTVASDAMAYVVDDPSVLFAIQADDAPANVDDIYGKNCLLVQTAPNTDLKISRVALDISELDTDPENPIRVVDYLGGDAGDEKGSAYPILVCKFNYHQHTSTTGSA